MAFTLVEVLAVLTILAVLGVVMLPALARTTTVAKIAQCEVNLKQDVLALQQFAGDNGNVLPAFNGGNWPWDVPATMEYTLESYGIHRAQLYDPGFPNQNIDQMWNYTVIYNSKGVPTSGYRTTGYVFVLAGSARVYSDDLNVSLDTKVLQVNGSDPELTQTIAANNGLINIAPARRVLACDALTSAEGQTDSFQYRWYNWNLHTDVGSPGNFPWTVTPYGPWLGSTTPHLSVQLFPTGGNEGMLDGHVKWVPFYGMAVHTSGSGDAFWWQSDPAKL